MKKAVFGFAIILFLTLIPMWATAGVSVTIKLDRSEATLEDTIRMVVKVSGTRSSDSKPVLHGLEQFTMTQGGASSRVEIINGKVNAEIDYTFFLQPRKLGTFQIGPAEITVDGKILKSNSSSLIVKAPSQESGPDHGPLFIEAEISSHEVFVEEQATYTLKLYCRTRVSDVSLNLPDVEHIVFKQLGEPFEYRSTYRGLDYQVMEIRYALLPSGEGAYIIGPTKMNMTVLQPDDRSAFGRFFKDPFFNDPLFKDPFFSFSSGRPLALATKSLKLNVHPLPEQGKPDNFSGLVGDFHMESKLEPARIRTGESATLTVQVSGRGNANRIPDLKIPEMNHTKIYADQPVLKMEQNEKGLGGTKTMKWALVPEKAGQIEIPSLGLSFFDTETGEYKLLHTHPRTLSVLPGERQEAVASKSVPTGIRADQSLRKQEIKELGKDILPIHTATKDLSISYWAVCNGWIFWLALIGPFSVYIMAFFTLKLRKRSPEILAQSRSKKAFKELMKRCRKEGLSYNDVINAVKDYLNSRFNLSIGVLTADEVVGVLKEQGVRDETVERAGSLIRKLEDAVYTGRGQEHADLAKDVSEFVKATEKEIR